MLGLVRLLVSGAAELPSAPVSTHTTHTTHTLTYSTVTHTHKTHTHTTRTLHSHTHTHTHTHTHMQKHTHHTTHTVAHVVSFTPHKHKYTFTLGPHAYTHKHTCTHYYIPSLSLAVVTCPLLRPPKDGRVLFSSTTYQSVAEYECFLGYRLEGVDQRVCQANGSGRMRNHSVRVSGGRHTNTHTHTHTHTTSLLPHKRVLAYHYIFPEFISILRE